MSQLLESGSCKDPQWDGTAVLFSNHCAAWAAGRQGPSRRNMLMLLVAAAASTHVQWHRGVRTNEIASAQAPGWDEVGGTGLGVRARYSGEIVADVRSAFQHIQVVQTVAFGNMLIIDDDLQLTERDEASYHEMLTHVPSKHFGTFKLARGLL